MREPVRGLPDSIFPIVLAAKKLRVHCGFIARAVPIPGALMPIDQERLPAWAVPAHKPALDTSTARMTLFIRSSFVRP